MAKWIELSNGELVNLDRICNIRKYNKTICKGIRYVIEYYSDGVLSSEYYNDEIERGKRFEEIKAMLLNKWDTGNDKL